VSVLRLDSGTDVVLGPVLAKAGEGTIHEVVGHPQWVAKVFHPTLTDLDAKFDKIAAMAASPPDEAVQQDSFVVLTWPLHVLAGDGGPVGYVMPRIDTRTAVEIHTLSNPSNRANPLPSAPQWPKAATWFHLVTVAANLCLAVETAHRTGAVIGDFQERNIMVSDATQVTLVDCDSMQFIDPVGHQYLCGVGRPEFTAPELADVNLRTTPRDTASDLFVLAVHIHLLLMAGNHPFLRGAWTGAGDQPDGLTLAKAGHWAGGWNSPLHTHPLAPPVTFLPRDVQHLFNRAFTTGSEDPTLRPTATEWRAALHRITTTACPRGTHQIPTQCTNCPWCAIDDERHNRRRTAAQSHGTAPLTGPLSQPNQPVTQLSPWSRPSATSTPATTSYPSGTTPPQYVSYPALGAAALTPVPYPSPSYQPDATSSIPSRKGKGPIASRRFVIAAAVTGVVGLLIAGVVVGTTKWDATNAASSPPGAPGSDRPIPPCGGVGDQELGDLTKLSDLVSDHTSVGCQWLVNNDVHGAHLSFTWFRGSDIAAERKTEEGSRASVEDLTIDGHPGWVAASDPKLSQFVCEVAMALPSSVSWFEWSISFAQKPFPDPCGTAKELAKRSITALAGSSVPDTVGAVEGPPAQQFPTLLMGCEALGNNVISTGVGVNASAVTMTFVGAVCRWHADIHDGAVDITRQWFDKGRLDAELNVAKRLGYATEDRTIANVRSVVLRTEDGSNICGVVSSAGGVVGWWVTAPSGVDSCNLAVTMMRATLSP
jgi:eukaryotic-like serine/threonine-protein kinase